MLRVGESQRQKSSMSCIFNQKTIRNRFGIRIIPLPSAINSTVFSLIDISLSQCRFINSSSANSSNFIL